MTVSAAEVPQRPPTLPRLRVLPAPPRPPDVIEPVALPPGQQVLPLEHLLPGGLTAVPTVLADTAERAAADGSPVAPWAARLAQAVLEVVAAERPVGQLCRWVSPRVYQRLDRRHRLQVEQRGSGAGRPRSAEQVRSVHVFHPSANVAEVAVISSGASPGGQRCRAMAIRLERRRGRWVCTELDWP